MIRHTQVLLFICLGLVGSTSAFSHEHAKGAEGRTKESSHGSATYLANEALLVEHNDTKVLFDPFFHNGFNHYQLVPNEIREALFNGKAPYNDIDAIFVSHAHGDHFAADDVFTFMSSFPETELIAPQQAVDLVSELDKDGALAARLIAIDLAYQDPPVTQSLDELEFDAVRIPHAGWPQRADVSNLVFRVSLGKQLTVIHMGDADPDDAHFKPLIEHWNSKDTDVAFPPYWFFTSQAGPFILEKRLKAKHNIGVHVPIRVPADLEASGAQYFTNPGQVQRISTNKPAN